MSEVIGALDRGDMERVRAIWASVGEVRPPGCPEDEMIASMYMMDQEYTEREEEKAAEEESRRLWEMGEL